MQESSFPVQLKFKCFYSEFSNSSFLNKNSYTSVCNLIIIPYFGGVTSVNKNIPSSERFVEMSPQSVLELVSVHLSEKKQQDSGKISIILHREATCAQDELQSMSFTDSAVRNTEERFLGRANTIY